MPEEFNFVYRGWLYISRYATDYWLVLILPLCAFFAYAPSKKLLQNKKSKHQSALVHHKQAWTSVVCVLLVLVQAAYMFRIGGDGTFRFMAVIAPFVFIPVALATVQMPRWLAAAVVAVTVSVSVLHWQTFASKPRYDVLPNVGGHWYHDKLGESLSRQWHAVGVSLHNLFGGLGDYPADAKIAVTAGGYVPYYSRLYALEMHGWADPRVLEDGNHVFLPHHPGPGHHHRASYRFMSALGINLIFWHPILVPAGADAQPFLNQFGRENLRPGLFDYGDNFNIVAIPIGGGNRVLALYFTPNKTIDEIFARAKITAYPITH